MRGVVAGAFLGASHGILGGRVSVERHMTYGETT
jgi:hypothetical protein